MIPIRKKNVLETRTRMCTCGRINSHSVNACPFNKNSFQLNIHCNIVLLTFSVVKLISNLKL